MTVDDFFAELPALGPWSAHTRLGLIRNTAGLCPLQAVCRSRGMPIAQGFPGGCSSFADRLGMPLRLVEDLQDAADGLAPVYAKVGASPAEVTALAKLRQRMLIACGVAE